MAWAPVRGGNVFFGQYVDKYRIRDSTGVMGLLVQTVSMNDHVRNFSLKTKNLD